MNAIDQSLNRLPCHTDWRRYDSPTVIRRHGRGFLERSFKPGVAVAEVDKLSKAELHHLVESFGGLVLPTADAVLLLFADFHWAKRCEQHLTQRGVPSLRLGCHIQLPDAWQ
ncbi:hypothetical protein [Methylomonas fluvii]|uniref:Uncharacterized protein n=1 Tax=Methylomonas fluvii TaxID=1854564 RepID=A0ABR9DGS4_9GAMM|nr:hypothetical protein [Methylomonas fluvii]MBD9362267.1 hypothetical protein [Methylomonas fluvii]CAD6875325.1 hypothetical protein [Methylomonas fluvii]